MTQKTETTICDGRADSVAAELFAISRSATARAIKEGRLLAENIPVEKPGMFIAAGTALSLLFAEPTELSVEKENIPVDILYQDEDLAVVIKPHGMVVHPAAGNESGTLVNALLFALDGLSGIGGVKRPGIVHRLDKDTSGLLLIAKNDAAHLSLSRQLKERTVEKHYLAVAEGEMKQESGRIDLPIARSKKDRKRMAIDAEGRDALTDWTLLENLRGAALLDVHIHTGRTHQIRIHLQHLHHPIAGDTLYGIKSGVRVPRLMLHAHTLAFDHPRTHERMFFTAPPGEAFDLAVQKLRKG